MSRLTLSEVIGLRTDLEQKLAGGEGDVWKEALKKFLRKENPWATQIGTSLDWQGTYCGDLGMADQWYRYMGSVPFREPKGQWVFPMLMGLDVNKLVEAYYKHGVKVVFCEHCPSAQNGGLVVDYRDPNHKLTSFCEHDLNSEITYNQRDPSKGSYLVGFRANQEADEEYTGQSAAQLIAAEAEIITLPERLYAGLAYFRSKMQHLDQETLTYCVGTHDSYGRIPVVYFNKEEQALYIIWALPSACHEDLRARGVIKVTSDQ